MNDSAKKGILIAVVIIALAVAAFSAKSLFGGDQMQVENKINVPAGTKSEKEQALEGQKGGAPAPFKERDLGG